MSVEGAAAGKRLHLFFVSPRKAFTCFLRGDFPFYTFYTFYNVINERVNYINIYTTYFYKFLQNKKNRCCFYKMTIFLQV